jgi:hypothetical protein
MRQPMKVCENIWRRDFSAVPRCCFGSASFFPEADEDGKEIVSQSHEPQPRFAPMVNIR